MTDQAQGQSGADAAPGSIESVAQRLLSRMEAPATDKPKDEESKPVAKEAKPEPEAKEAKPAEESPESTETESETPKKYTVPKLDGEGDEELTAEELRAQRLMQQDYTKKTQSAADLRKEAEGLRAQVTQKASEIDRHIQVLRQMAASELQGVDLAKLKAENPQAFVQVVERQAQYAAAMESAQKAQQGLYSEQVQRNLAENSKALNESIPEWNDPVVAKRESADLRQFLVKQGFAEEAINKLGEFEGDHRLVAMARKAMLYEKGAAKAAEIKPKVEAAPKVVKPSSSRNVADEKQRELRTQVRKSGRVEDVAALLEQRYKQ